MPMIVCEVQIFISPRGPLRESACIVPRAPWAFELASAPGPLFLLGLTSCAWSPAGVRPAGAPLRCGRRGAGPRSTEQERRERREASQFCNMCPGGPRGYPGSKTSTPKTAMDPRRPRCIPNWPQRASPGVLGNVLVLRAPSLAAGGPLFALCTISKREATASLCRPRRVSHGPLRSAPSAQRLLASRSAAWMRKWGYAGQVLVIRYAIQTGSETRIATPNGPCWFWCP
jgi:hypothetical protein